MTALTHEQIQKYLRSGDQPVGLEKTAFLEHLSTCRQCQTYEQLVGDLSRDLPGLFPENRFSEYQILQKAAVSKAALKTRFLVARSWDSLRTAALVALPLLVILFIGLIALKLIPVLPVSPISVTETPPTITAPTATPAPDGQAFCHQMEQTPRSTTDSTLYCDSNYGIALDIPQNWSELIELNLPPAPSAPVNIVRRIVRLQPQDDSNYIRLLTRPLHSDSLSTGVKISLGNWEFPENDYPDLKIGGNRAYAVLNTWQQDYNSVSLFFQHGAYYTEMELKAITQAGLDQNWEIARTLLVIGEASDKNNIPLDLIADSYTLLPQTSAEFSSVSTPSPESEYYSADSFGVNFGLWSRLDTSLLVFNSNLAGLVPSDQTGTMRPYIYNLDTGSIIEILPTLGGNNRAAPPMRALSISANGRWLLYGLSSNASEPAADHYNYVWLRDLSTKTDTKIDFLPLEKEIGTAIYPYLSPGGDYLALNVADSGWQLYLYEIITKRLTPVSVDRGSRWIPGSDSTDPVFSSFGYLAFVSTNSKLVAGDTACSEDNPACADVFLYKMATGKIERIPANIQFTMGNPDTHLTVSDEARYLAWTELLTPSPIYRPVIQLHDRLTGITQKFTFEHVFGNPIPKYSDAHSPSISADGRWLAVGSMVTSQADNPPASGAFSQVYLIDLLNDTITLVSADASGNLGNGPSGVVALQQEGWSSDIQLSADGRYVAFSSQAANLLPAGVKQRQCNDQIVGKYICYDLYIYDRMMGSLTWVGPRN